MNFNINENKLISVFQKMIDIELSALKSLDSDDVGNLSDGTLEDVHTIESIKIVSLDIGKFQITDVQYYKLTVDVIYDSVGSIALDSILNDIEDHLKRYTGLIIGISEGEVHNKYLDYGQW